LSQLSRPRFKLQPLVAAVLCALAAPAVQAQEQTLGTVTVTAGGMPSTTEGSGSYTSGASNTATRFDLSLRDTPQSVSIITRTQMDDFGFTDVNEALKSTTGVIVEQVETDRTYYTARGFDITNFQVDGIGLPFVYGNVGGNLDTAIYDRVEVLRGGTGLTAGMSDPSATINFVRKRPTGKLQASTGVTAGSWSNRRLDADVSGALNDAGTVRGRMVAAHQDRESYLDRYAHKKSVLYGVIETDIGNRTMLSLGHHLQDNDADSPLWGALPLYNTHGEPTRYAVSTSSSADWAYWDGKKNGTFLELAHNFENGWQGKAVLTRGKTAENSRLFYVYGTPNPVTAGSDLYSYPSLYDFASRQTILDAYASGPFSLLGRRHELVVGANWSKSETTDISHYGEDIGTEIPALETWNGSYPLPAFSGGTDGSNMTDRQTSLYGAARLNLTDRLTVIGGTRVTNLDSEGRSYGNRRTKSYDSVFTPYAGLTYRLTDTYSAYGSYTKLFRPQFEVDITGNRLDAVTGKSAEAGIKGEFMNRKLNATFAVFRTKQNNLAEAAGFSTFSYHTPSDELTSTGYELDIAGQLLPNLQLSAGYTYVKIEDDSGNHARTHVPKRLLRLAASYRVPAVEGLKLGASLNWQDDIFVAHTATATTGPNAGSPITSRQDSYALLNLMARYDFTKSLSATLNLNNVTDEKYFQSLYWASFGQAYYGAPRNVSLSLNWKY
jgi:outer membrane receptor for ferric coprogen and ferric-rhodotorulic acid